MTPGEPTALEVLAHVLQHLLFVRHQQPRGAFVILSRRLLEESIEDIFVALATLRHHGQGEG